MAQDRSNQLALPVEADGPPNHALSVVGESAEQLVDLVVCQRAAPFFRCGFGRFPERSVWVVIPATSLHGRTRSASSSASASDARTVSRTESCWPRLAAWTRRRSTVDSDSTRTLCARSGTKSSSSSGKTVGSARALPGARLLPSSDGPIQPRQGDAIVGQRLGLGVLGLGERELSVGQLQDRSDPDVEASLGEAEVLLSRTDQNLGRLDSLLRGLDGDLRLLEVLEQRQLGRLDPCVRGAEVRLGFLVRRDQTPAVEDSPRKGEAERPSLVELGPSASVRADATDVGQEVPRGHLDIGFGGRALQLRRPVLRALAESFGPQGLPVERDRLVLQIVPNLRGRARLDRHRSVESDARWAERVSCVDQAD